MLILLLAAICLVFVLALRQTSRLNARLRALEQRPMSFFAPIVAFVASFLVGLGIGLIIVNGFVIVRNTRARRLIAASTST
jgi:uncharacterized membrane protein YfcA